jgi:hypothetical protein
MSGARGEATIRAGDREVQVLFTNRAILAAEKQAGKGIIQMLNEFSAGGSYTDLVALLRAGMEAARLDARSGGKPVSNDDAINVLDAVGFAAAAGPVMEALAAVISYDGGEGEADPNG